MAELLNGFDEMSSTQYILLLTYQQTKTNLTFINHKINTSEHSINKKHPCWVCFDVVRLTVSYNRQLRL